MRTILFPFALVLLLLPFRKADAQWTLRTSNTARNLTSVVWNGSELIATGGNGVLLVSGNNGVTWQERDTMPNAAPAENLIWVEDRVISSNASGNLYHSTDLQNWTGTNVQSPQWRDFAWNGRRLVVAGTASSSVGIGPHTGGHLFTFPSASPALGGMQSIATNGSIFVAVGIGGAIATSENGETWTARTSPTASTLQKVRWTGARFLSVGANGAFAYSADGISWAGSTIGDGTVSFHGVTEKPAPDAVITVVGNGGTIFTAPNANLAFVQTSPAGVPTGQSLSDIIWTGRQFVAVGNSGAVITNGTSGGHPLITLHPDPADIVVQPNVPITLNAAARGAASVLWQTATAAGGPWTALTASSPGFNTPGVTVTTNATRYYRFSATNTHGTAFSRAVRLTTETPTAAWTRRNGSTVFGSITSDGRLTYARSGSKIHHSIDGRIWVESLAATGKAVTGIAIGPDSAAASTEGGGSFAPYPPATALFSTDPRFWNTASGSGTNTRPFIAWGSGAFLSGAIPLSLVSRLNLSNPDGGEWGSDLFLPGYTIDGQALASAFWDGSDFRILGSFADHFKLRPGLPPTRERLYDPVSPAISSTTTRMIRWRDREILLGNNRLIYSLSGNLDIAPLTTVNNTYDLRSIAANKDRIFVAGRRTPAGGGGPVLLTSTDGVNFTDATPPTATGQFSSVHWNGSQFLLNDSTGGLWTLGPAGTGPAILSVPRRVVTWTGEPAILQVTARGENLSYQWYKNADYSTAGGPVFSGGPVFNAGVATEPATYWVRVTGQRGVHDSPLIHVTPGIAGRDFDSTALHGSSDTTALVYNGLSAHSAAADGSVRSASTPFTNWSAAHSQPGVRFNAIASSAFANSVAVGNGGAILHYNGFTWTARTSGTTANLNAILWTGSHFFAAGDGGVILRSADGVAWTPVTPSGGGFTAPVTNLRGIAFDGTFLVFVGDGGLIFRSNAPNLNLSSIRTSGTTQRLNAVLWERGKFLAAGDASTILQSGHSATTWTANPLSGLPYASQLHIASLAANWTDGGYLALANDGILLHSPDGVVWNRHRAPTGGQLSALAWHGGRWIAAGSSGTYHLSGRGTRINLAPAVLQHPQSATIPSGTGTTLSYTARGPGVWSSWQFRDNPLAPFQSVANSNAVSLATPNLIADRQYKVVLNNPWGGPVETNTAQITIGVTLDGFPKWLSDRGYTNPNPNDDPENFGIPNIVRYALNLPDNRASAFAALNNASIVQDGGAFLQLLYTRLAGLSDATVEVRFSRDLVDWKPLSELGGTDIQTGTSPPDTELRRARVPTSGEPRLFLRISATLNPP